MELYTLDSEFGPAEVIDQYSSFVWTERFNDVGECELEGPLNVDFLSKLTIGTRLGLDLSNRAMEIDTIEIDRDDDDVEMLKIKAREITDILRFRTTWKYGQLGLGDNPSFGTSNYSAQSIIYYAIRQATTQIGGTWATLNPDDVIPNLVLLPNDTAPGHIVPPPEGISHYITSPMLTLDYIRDLAVPWRLGFRMFLEKWDGNVYAQVYSGYNRTLDQSVNEPVLFATGLDNIRNLNLIHTNRDYVQSVKLYTKNSYRGSTSPNDSERFGFTKRTQFHTLQEPALTGQALQDWMQQQNMAYMANHVEQVLLDGQITETSGYEYGVDYNLGDIVEVKTDWGFSSQCRIMEQIFTDDAESGPQAYPTVETETVVTPGSWLGAGTQTWSTPSPDDTWSER